MSQTIMYDDSALQVVKKAVDFTIFFSFFFSSNLVGPQLDSQERNTEQVLCTVGRLNYMYMRSNYSQYSIVEIDRESILQWSNECVGTLTGGQCVAEGSY